MKIFQLVVSILVLLQGKGSEESVSPLRLARHETVAIKWESSIQVDVNHSVLNESMKWVNVTWSGVPSPADDDWIGLWLLPDNSSSINPMKHAPVKYQYCSTTYGESHFKTGSGQLRFYMVNMRGTFQFALLRKGLKTPTLSAVSNKVAFENHNEPLQGHLSLTKNYTEMVLMWVTRDVNGPQVQWGKVPGKYENTKNATSATYTASDMCDSPAMDYGWIDPGMIHKVVMEGLTPATRYYYHFGSSTGGWSDERGFVAPPIPGPNVITKVLTYGDLGHGVIDNTSELVKKEDPSLNTTRRLLLEADNHDLIMHVGDICYANGYAAVWEEFFDQLNPVMLRLPYMVNPGNHESDSINSSSFFQGHDSEGECSIPYLNRFSMPRLKYDQPWYGFEYGSIHVIMMSTEHDFQTSSLQYLALVNLFEAVNRTRTPWLIFSGHRPMYVDSKKKSDEVQDIAKTLRKNIEPLLLKYKVDLVLCGHHHSYQRTCSVYKEKCTEGAPVHIVIGMAGHSLSHTSKASKFPYIEFVDNMNYGYARFTTTSSTLTFEYIRDIDGDVGDTLTLKKD